MSGRCLFFVFFVFASNLFAQEGKVSLIQDWRLEKLVNKQVEINLAKRKINGFRIQIHFGIQREPAKEIKSKFLLKYPETEAYEIYQQPNFKIRVGDFRTKLDAYRFLKQIQVEFPNSFIVADEIQMQNSIN
jgi:hypothetical protein